MCTGSIIIIIGFLQHISPCEYKLSVLSSSLNQWLDWLPNSGNCSPITIWCLESEVLKPDFGKSSTHHLSPISFNSCNKYHSRDLSCRKSMLCNTDMHVFCLLLSADGRKRTIYMHMLLHAHTCMYTCRHTLKALVCYAVTMGPQNVKLVYRSYSHHEGYGRWLFPSFAAVKELLCCCLISDDSLCIEEKTCYFTLNRSSGASRVVP